MDRWASKWGQGTCEKERAGTELACSTGKQLTLSSLRFTPLGLLGHVQVDPRDTSQNSLPQRMGSSQHMWHCMEQRKYWGHGL